ncbi:hypothetical protein PHBOTO_004399 [Pseudozyma hubeiensis]|nr:hypothetical protein PHBOTO_004399 [Pseudozyma hubeiensis]
MADSAPPSTTLTPTLPTITPTTSAALRLSTLSHLVYGSTPPPPPSNAAALPRLSSIISTLTALSTDPSHKSISRLLHDWSDHADLLTPLPSSNSSAGEVWDAHQQLVYLLSQQVELQESLKSLESMQTLVEERKVLESGRALTRLTDQKERLERLREREEQLRAADQVRMGRVLALVNDWSEYTSTLSQAFTLLDGQVWQLERQVAALERETAVTS